MDSGALIFRLKFIISNFKIISLSPIVILSICLFLPVIGFCGDAENISTAPQLGRALSLWSVLPFGGILLSIALFPLFAPHFWHDHFGKVAFFWAALFALPFIAVYRGIAFFEIIHILVIDYIPFIILLWALFTVASGIVVSAVPRGTPVVNTFLLGIGTLLASWIGTTGAAMVMIRPVLKANALRARKSHVICFFIILVANVGGGLTPLGDPPLFLGFLHNVPFFWVTMAVLPHVLFTAIIILLIFFAVDIYHFRKERHSRLSNDDAQPQRFRIEGAYNFIFLAGIVGSVVMSGYWKAGSANVFGLHLEIQNLIRDVLLICIGVAAFKFTPGALREKNEFSWAPIKEVAKLFAGIFVTIIPAIAILRAGRSGPLGLISMVNDPAGYFWFSGGLSSVLDNAPTYLTFFNQILGSLQMTESMIPEALGQAAHNPAFVSFLKAISVGCVFMGANTYIGNAPNFMVKSIAEEAGVNMPSFFGYVLKYTIPVLIPVFVVVTFVFF
jgi:Na+/H+ antiporter NhaD/arsenite permease-like protein